MLWRRQAHQGTAQLGQGVGQLVERNIQLAQQHVERRFTVELQHQIAVDFRDRALAPHRLRALGHARNQVHVGPKGHAAQSADEHAAGRALALQMARAAGGELHVLKAAGRETAEHITRRRSLRHFSDQLGQLGRAPVGVH